MRIVKDLGVLPISSKSKYRARFCIYECTECKDHFKANVAKVKSRKTELCPKCAKDGRHKKTHGMKGTRIYTTWQNMKARCNNKNNKSYSDYGGRGITVCKEWLNSFEAFYTWAVKNNYTDLLEIDRINNDLGYAPENCRWVDSYTQGANKRVRIKNNGLCTGIHPYKNKFKAMITHKDNPAVYLGVYNTLEEAVNVRNKYIENNDLPHTKVNLNILREDKNGITN